MEFDLRRRPNDKSSTARLAEQDAARTKRLVLRRKLLIGSANDPAEREADALADAAVRRLSTLPSSGVGGRAHDDGGRIRRVEDVGDGADGFTAPPEVESRIQRARSGGAPLDDTTRGRFEDAIGADLGEVRIHHDQAADELNQAVSAKAFTTGNDVFFSAGTYEPSTARGQHLLAHELAHTVQQTGAVQRDVVRRRLDKQNIDWQNVTTVSFIPQGASNKGIFKIVDANSSLVIKFTNEQVKQSTRFGDMVANTVGLANPESHLISNQPVVAGLAAGIQQVTNAMTQRGQVAEAQVVTQALQDKGSAGASSALVMNDVVGVDLGNQIQAQSPHLADVAKQAAQAEGGDPNFDVVAWFAQPAFVQNLGRMAVADVLMGNQDRFSVIARGNQMLPTFNPANFKVLGAGLVGTFDHDTVIFSQELFATKTKKIDPLEWVKTLIGGEDYKGKKVSERPTPALGAIFTTAGQTAIYDEMKGKLESDLSDADKIRLAQQFTFGMFAANFAEGCRVALVHIRDNAAQLRQAATQLGGADNAEGTLDPHALDVKLAFLSAKAGEVEGKDDHNLRTAVADNTKAEASARAAGMVALIATGKLFEMAPGFDQIPNNPRSLNIISKTNRKARSTGRDAASEEAQDLREQAQSVQPGADFMANLDANITRLEQINPRDRRVESAIFHLRALRAVREATAWNKRFKDAYALLDDSWKLDDHARAKLGGADIEGRAAQLLGEYRTQVNAWKAQMHSGDKEQKARMDGLFSAVNYPLQRCINKGKNLRELMAHHG